jgi:hypothetical protein
MKKITKPTQFEHADYYRSFIQLVNENVSVLDQLKNNAKELEVLLLTLTETQLTTTYAAGKWCIKDIVQHLIDCEKVFVYSAMRFARHYKTAQPFFDENEFAKAANAKAIPAQLYVRLHGLWVGMSYTIVKLLKKSIYCKYITALLQMTSMVIQPHFFITKVL